ncbi:MAG TPA: GAF domain-containing protein [Anaerolineales bacterium]
MNNSAATPLTRLGSAIRRMMENKKPRGNETRYRDIFENANIAIWEEDFSEVKSEFDKLHMEGVTDFRNYIMEHPEFLERSVQQVKIIDANEAMLRLYDAKEKSDVLGSLGKFVSPQNFQEELIAFAEGESYFEREIVSRTLDGNLLDLLLTIRYYIDDEGNHKALAHMTDITGRKKAEDDLRSQNEYLALINEMTSAILLSSDYDAIMRSLASKMKKIIKADDCYILRWNEETKLAIPVATTARLDFPFTEAAVHPEEMGITASILRVGRVIAIEDVFSSPYINFEIVKRYPAKSIIGIPLIAGNQKLGVAIIAFNSPHSFTPQEIEHAELAGNQVAVALLDLQQHLEIQRRLKESTALMKISRALSETERVGTDKVLQLIVDSALDLIGQAKESVIHLMDVEQDTLVPRAIAGFDTGTKASERHRINLKDGVSGYVIKTGETINIGDIFDSPLYVHKETTPSHRSLMVAPVQSGGKPIGTISVQSNHLNAFSTSDVDLLNGLSIQAAIALENTRLFETTQQSLKEINALYLTNQGLASSLDTDELLNDVVNLLQQNFGYYHAQIYLMEQSSGDLILKSGSGEIGARLLEMEHRLPRGTGVVGHAIETATPFVTNNVNDIMFFSRNPLLPDTQSEMTVPIIVDGKVMGVIDIQEKPPNRLTDNDLQLLIAVADQLSVGLQKASLYENLQTSLHQEQTVRSQLVQSERLALVGRLLASVSHELNNPLQAIQNALFLLKDEERLSPQGKQDLDVILSEAERMASLIERLRSAYRPGRVRDFRPVELNDLIEDVHTLIATHMRQKQISLEFHPSSDLPPVSGMSDQIRQVVLNLFLNAIEVMKPGGRLIVWTRNLPQQNEVLLSVKDTGPGIAPELLPQIFDAFITDKQTGTGLGLTISRDIIEQHFGRIEAENAPGDGAIFNIWLPIDQKGQE